MSVWIFPLLTQSNSFNPNVSVAIFSHPSILISNFVRSSLMRAFQCHRPRKAVLPWQCVPTSPAAWATDWYSYVQFISPEATFVSQSSGSSRTRIYRAHSVMSSCYLSASHIGSPAPSQELVVNIAKFATFSLVRFNRRRRTSVNKQSSDHFCFKLRVWALSRGGTPAVQSPSSRLHFRKLNQAKRIRRFMSVLRSATSLLVVPR